MRGYLLCATCKEILHLGKLYSDDGDKHLSFWRGDLTGERLGQEALAFLAHHMNYSTEDHDVQVVYEHYVDAMDQDGYRRVGEPGPKT